MNNPYEINLEKRLAYLEETNLFKMMALDLTRELGEFHSSINQLKTPHTNIPCLNRLDLRERRGPFWQLIMVNNSI